MWGATNDSKFLRHVLRSVYINQFRSPLLFGCPVSLEWVVINASLAIRFEHDERVVDARPCGLDDCRDQKCASSEKKVQ